MCIQDPKSIQGLSFIKLKQELKYKKGSKVDTMNYANLRLLIFHLCEDFNLISTLVEQTSKLRCLIMYFSSQDHIVKIQKGDIDRFWNIAKHKDLSQMRVLHLDNCEFLETFPNDSFKSLPLIDLHLENCMKLKELTTNLGSMIFLVALHLENCPILEVLPKEWTSLIALKELEIITCNSLKTISNGIGSLTCLTRLYI